MLLVLIKVLADSPFSSILYVLWVYVLSLCFSYGVCWYFAIKLELGGHARRVVGNASGIGRVKN
jgi:hypothetical protein